MVEFDKARDNGAAGIEADEPPYNSSGLVTAPLHEQIKERILRQIPAAALASIVVPAFVRPDGRFSLWTPELAAGALAALVAWRTRSSILTLVVGMVVLVALDAL